jgi:hypothetical protein
MNTIDAPFAHQFLQRLHAAVNAHDAPAIAALCCDDVVWEDPAAPETLRGRDAVLRFHRDVMFPALPDVRVELIDGPYLSLDGASVAARLRISGTMTGALKPPGFAPTGGPLSCWPPSIAVRRPATRSIASVRLRLSSLNWRPHAFAARASSRRCRPLLTNSTSVDD